MKTGTAYLFIGLALVVGFVSGVIVTVYHGESPELSSIGPQSSTPGQPPAPGPLPLTADLKNQIELFQTILKKEPDNLNALVQLGNIYFDTDQVDKAIETYGRVLKIDPKNADVRTDMGIMYRRKSDFDRAIAEFKQAAADNPQHVNSRYNMGIVLLHDKGDIPGAVKAWEEYLKVDPGSPRAQNIRQQMEKMKAMVK
ncbi:MAG: tetratricopeptide repeat protein [Deltaproteobacteria bacterium]|nr:tetratricopeptide repeat protein [Deltaproteobacteria bacterium]